MLRDVISGCHLQQRGAQGLLLPAAEPSPACPGVCLPGQGMQLLLSCLHVQSICILEAHMHTHTHRGHWHSQSHRQGSAFKSTYIQDWHKTQAQTAKSPPPLWPVRADIAGDSTHTHHCLGSEAHAHSQIPWILAHLKLLRWVIWILVQNCNTDNEPALQKVVPKDLY